MYSNISGAYVHPDFTLFFPSCFEVAFIPCVSYARTVLFCFLVFFPEVFFHSRAIEACPVITDSIFGAGIGAELM